MVLLRRVVAGKVETQLVEASFTRKLTSERKTASTPERLQGPRRARSRWRRQNGNRCGLELLRRRRGHLYRCNPKRLRLYFLFLAARDNEQPIDMRASLTFAFVLTALVLLLYSARRKLLKTNRPMANSPCE